MRIAARMALQGSEDQHFVRARGYDGIDVIVGKISEHGFMAETNASFPPQAFVRLKLPGVGSVYARIISAKGGSVSGTFVTPLAPGRLQRTIGLTSRPAAN